MASAHLYAFYFWIPTYSYGKHIVPHDFAMHEYSTGLSRVEVAKNHSIVFTIVPDIAFFEDIDAVKNLRERYIV